MSEIELENELDNYINKRFVYYIGVTPFSDAALEEFTIINDSERILTVLKNILEFQENYRDCIPLKMQKNFYEFASSSSIKFNDKFKSNEFCHVIGKIIENAKEAKFDNSRLFADELPKFNDMELYKKYNKNNLDYILSLEETVFKFVLDFLKLEDEKLDIKYGLGDTEVLNKEYLYAIEYLVHDYPLIFKKEKFYTRVTKLLKDNEERLSSKEVKEQAKSLKLLPFKISFKVYMKNLREKNNKVYEKVESSYKRS